MTNTTLHIATPKIDLALVNNFFIDAAMNDNLEMIEFYLKTGADIDVKDKNGNTALDVAVTKKYRYADYESYSTYQLQLQKNKEIVQYLIDKGAKISKKTMMTLIQQANSNNDQTKLIFLFNKKAEIDANERNKQAEIEVNDQNNIALRDASSQGNIANATLLLNNGADVNSKNLDDQTPLHLAITNNQIEMINFLIEKGADVNAQDKEMRTPLYLACKAKQYAVVRTLANQLNTDGATKCNVELLPPGITTLLELFPDDKKDNNVAEIQSTLRNMGCKEKKLTTLQSMNKAASKSVLCIFAAIYDIMHKFLSILFPSLFKDNQHTSKHDKTTNPSFLERGELGISSLTLINAQEIALPLADVERLQSLVQIIEALLAEVKPLLAEMQPISPAEKDVEAQQQRLLSIPQILLTVEDEVASNISDKSKLLTNTTPQPTVKREIVKALVQKHESLNNGVAQPNALQSSQTRR